MTTNEIAVVVLSVGMVLAIVGIIIERILSKKGIGLRVIQFLAAALLIPSIVILGLNRVLSSEAIAALFGAVAGYILASIGKEESKN